MLETGCGRLPYWLEQFDDLHERGEDEPAIYDGLLRRKISGTRTKPSDLFTSGRMIVSCEPGEKTLPYVVSAVGGQCIMYASDYPTPTANGPTLSRRSRKLTFRLWRSNEFSARTRRGCIGWAINAGENRAGDGVNYCSINPNNKTSRGTTSDFGALVASPRV